MYYLAIQAAQQGCRLPIYLHSMPLSSYTRETAFFQNAAGQVLYNTEGGYVRLAWASGRIDQRELETFYEQALQLMHSTNTYKVLSDHGNRMPLPTAAQQWLVTNWIPRAVQEVDFSYCAIVEGADPIHRLSTQSVVSTAPAAVLFKRFSAVAEADKWLKSC